MNDSCDRPGPRRTVLEMPPAQKKRPRHRKKPEFSISEQPNIHIDMRNQPIELTPVVDAIKEYGRRTYSLGALQGAFAIEHLLDKIKTLQPVNDELKEIIADAEKNVDHLKSYLHKVYVTLLWYNTY